MKVRLRYKVGTHAEVPTIYIPKDDDDDGAVGRKCPNDIEEVTVANHLITSVHIQDRV